MTSLSSFKKESNIRPILADWQIARRSKFCVNREFWLLILVVTAIVALLEELSAMFHMITSWAGPVCGIIGGFMNKCHDGRIKCHVYDWSVSKKTCKKLYTWSNGAFYESVVASIPEAAIRARPRALRASSFLIKDKHCGPKWSCQYIQPASLTASRLKWTNFEVTFALFRAAPLSYETDQKF